MATARSKARRTSNCTEKYEAQNQTSSIIAKRKLRSRCPSSSVPSKHRQQTITQMNPFRPLFYPDVEEEDMKLQYVGLDEHEISPYGRKRRKITKNAQSTAATEHPRLHIGRPIPKSASPRKLQNSEPTSIMEADGPRRLEKSAVLGLMPPPKTPQTLRRKEIPSSQSPIDTPLSAQSRTSLLEASRSPLRERSANFSGSRGNPKWAQTKEVSDSIDLEDDEDTSSPSRIFEGSHRALFRTTPVDVSAGLAPLPSGRPDTENGIDLISCEAMLRSTSYPSRTPQVSAASQTRPKTEVSDSDTEEEDENDRAFERGEDTQAIIASIPSSAIESTSQCGSTPISSREGRPSTMETLSHSTATEASLPIKSLSGGHNREVSEPTLPSSTHASCPIRSDSQLANAQLHAEMQRSKTLQGGLQTESQFEAGWASLHLEDGAYLEKGVTPPETAREPGFPPHFLTSPTQSHQLHGQIQIDLPTRHSAPTSTRKKTKITQSSLSDRLVPPSQATTVDITQKSSLIQIQSSQPLPSSPPLMPSDEPSSSLLEAHERKEEGPEPGRDLEWRASAPPLTDSQLLPPSLMMESILRPPEGWELEDLGDEQ